MLTVIDSRCPPVRISVSEMLRRIRSAMSVRSPSTRSGQDDEELFSSVADEDVAVAQDLASGKDGGLEHLITDEVAVGVVD